MYEVSTLSGGQTISHHSRGECGGVCPIHSPTEHHMKTWAQHWNHSRQIMERVCPHFRHHPDPDDYLARTRSDYGAHTCDGCCSYDGEQQARLATFLLAPSTMRASPATTPSVGPTVAWLVRHSAEPCSDNSCECHC